MIIVGMEKLGEMIKNLSILPLETSKEQIWDTTDKTKKHELYCKIEMKKVTAVPYSGYCIDEYWVKMHYIFPKKWDLKIFDRNWHSTFSKARNKHQFLNQKHLEQFEKCEVYVPLGSAKLWTEL